MQSSSQIITTNKPTSSFFTGRMPFLSPNQQCQSTEGKILWGIIHIKQMCCALCIYRHTISSMLMLFQVCDEPHPMLIKDMLQTCIGGDLDGAYRIMSHLWSLGYAPEDIIGIVFRVCKTHAMAEYLKLEFIKVWWWLVMVMICERLFYFPRLHHCDRDSEWLSFRLEQVFNFNQLFRINT